MTTRDISTEDFDGLMQAHREQCRMRDFTPHPPLYDEVEHPLSVLEDTLLSMIALLFCCSFVGALIYWIWG